MSEIRRWEIRNGDKVERWVLESDHLAEVERLRKENAALVKALDEVTTILGTFQGLTPETRALCEKLFKDKTNG